MIELKGTGKVHTETGAFPVNVGLTIAVIDMRPEKLQADCFCPVEIKLYPISASCRGIGCSGRAGNGIGVDL